MRIYETTFIVNPQTDDATIDGQVKEVASLITANSGKILHEDRVGTRKLAYPINGLNHGYYTTITFEGENTLLTALERHYHLQESYIRHLTVVYEGEREKIGQPVDPFGFGQEGDAAEGEQHRGRGPRRGGRFERRDYDGGGRGDRDGGGRPPREHRDYGGHHESREPRRDSGSSEGGEF